MGFVDGDEEWGVFDVRIDVVIVDFVVDDVGEDGEDGEFFFCAVEVAGWDDSDLTFAEHGVRYVGEGVRAVIEDVAVGSVGDATHDCAPRAVFDVVPLTEGTF